MDYSETIALTLYFLLLAFLAIGGFPTVVPEMHRYVVDTHHFMTSAEFTHIYTLAQVAPGPNVMYVTLIGWHVGGWVGAILTTLTLVAPACTLTVLGARAYERNPNAPVGRAIRRGLAPVTLGLLFATGWILVTSANHDWRGYALTILAAVGVLRTRLNPLWMIAVGAAAGMLGLV